MHNTIVRHRLNSGSYSHKSPIDKTLTYCVCLSAAVVTFIFLWILVDLSWNGVQQITWSFLTEDPRNTGRSGGIRSIMVSTSLILAVCLITALPLGLSSAIFLAEFTAPGNLFGRCIRRSLDILAGVPSIVFGLFGYAFFSIYLKMGFSILSGGLTLACMVLPIFTRSTEEGLRSAPDSYRLAAAALGMTKTRTLFSIILPLAMPGLMVGFVLGIGRALAETAALIFTSGYVDRMPESLFDSGRSLSVHIYDLSMNVAGGEPHAYATALVLIALVLIVNLTATFITNHWVTQNQSS